MKKLAPYALLLPILMVLVYFQWQYKGYVKDDAYISLRYALNLSAGHGMVFNPGDRLEGYTNFLWVIMTLPAYWLGIDALNWVKVMGCVFGLLGVWVTWALARFFNGGRADAFSLLAAGLFATSPSVILWSQAGLEPPMMAVLCSGGALFAFRLWCRKADDRAATRDAIVAALLLSAAALTRPDAHAVVAIVGSMAVADAIRRRSVPRPWLIGLGVILAILVPYHLWRWLYFGDWLPNTYYVKAAAGPEVIQNGLAFARELFGFCANPLIFAGVAGSALVLVLARIHGRTLPGGLIPRLWALLLSGFFVLYMVKIGRDEMKWFRLYLPVYPLAIALAADTLRQGLGALTARLGGLESLGGRLASALVVLALLGGAASINLAYAGQKAGWYDNYRRWSERSFQAMGHYIADRSEPGERVAFQDMGAAPLAANDQVWIDTIGILNRDVAHKLAAIELNPFMRGMKRRTPGGAEAIRAFDGWTRDYVLDQEPAWLAFVAYVPKPSRRRFKSKVRALNRADDEGGLEDLFLRRIHGNSHAHGITRDRRFEANYRWERYWRRNDGYWLVLYQRRDHGDAG